MLFSLLCSFIIYSSPDSIDTNAWDIFNRTETNRRSITLSRDIQNKQEVPDTLKLFRTGDCSSYLLFTPDPLIYFDTVEYNILMNKQEKSFEDYLYYLTDNDVLESLYYIIYDKNSRILRYDRISIDININFGEILYSYFPDESGRIIYAIDWYCKKNDQKMIFFKINYCGFVPEKIVYHELDLYH